MHPRQIVLATPRWAIPLLAPARYKFLKGGRSGGKSHFFAELLIESLLLDPYADAVCLREYQKSLKYSSKKLLEEKIFLLGVGRRFRILNNEIRRLGTTGDTARIIFEGLNDHTADSIKSIESFKYAWFTEAQRASARSLTLLRPTLRLPNSELWFDWNPDQPTDPIEVLSGKNPPADHVLVHTNYESCPHLTDVMRVEAEDWRKNDPDTYPHVWLGEYNTNSEDQILHGKWRVADFEVEDSWGEPYYGVDWGFSTDPTAVIECRINENILYISAELCKTRVETDDLPEFLAKIPTLPRYVVRADNARPENISYCRRHGIPKIRATNKWPGSVEDGIAKLRSFAEIIVHPTCRNWETEARLYRYKKDRLTDEVLPKIDDRHNHLIDATRYAIEPLIKRRGSTIMDRPS